MSVWSALSATLCTSPDLELGYGNLRYLELLRLGATLTGCSRVPCGVVVCARRTVFQAYMVFECLSGTCWLRVGPPVGTARP